MLEQEKEEFEILTKIAKQRAGLMALIHQLIATKKDLTINQVKTVIVNFFNHMIEDDAMVGDNIDLEVAKLLLVTALELGAGSVPPPSAN